MLQKEICKFWSAGYCRHGQRCRFRHGLNDERLSQAPLCFRYSRNGYCASGVWCPLRHMSPPPSPPSPDVVESSHDPPAMIGLESSSLIPAPVVESSDDPPKVTELESSVELSCSVPSPVVESSDDHRRVTDRPLVTRVMVGLVVVNFSFVEGGGFSLEIVDPSTAAEVSFQVPPPTVTSTPSTITPGTPSLPSLVVESPTKSPESPLLAASTSTWFEDAKHASDKMLEVSQHLSAAQEVSTGLGKPSGSFEADIANIQNAMAKMQKVIEHLTAAQKAFSGLGGPLESLNSVISNIKEDVAHACAKMQNVNDHLSAAQEAFLGLGKPLGSLEVDISNMIKSLALVMSDPYSISEAWADDIFTCDDGSSTSKYLGRFPPDDDEPSTSKCLGRLDGSGDS